MKVWKGFMSLLVVLALLSSAAGTAMAWGWLTHTKMAMDAGNLYSPYDTEYRSGAIAPDSGYLSPLNNWGDEYHGVDVDTANLIGSIMVAFASDDREKAFAMGWWAHLSQDRVAHGSGQGLPNDPTYGIGYINYEAQQTGQDHTTVEFEVDGRVYYEKGAGGPVSIYTIPADLIYNTIKFIYGKAPSTSDIESAYLQLATLYYGEETFWVSPAGWGYYLSLLVSGKHSNYDDYVNAVNCNPYYESINLTKNPYSLSSVITEKKNSTNVRDLPNYWIVKYTEMLKQSGAIKIKTYRDSDGWYTIEIRMINKKKADELAEQILKEMVKSGTISEDVLEILDQIKTGKIKSAVKS